MNWPMWVLDTIPAKRSGTEDFAARMKGLHPEVAAKSRPPRHPRMHRTRSVDFGLILAGEIDLMLDEETTHLATPS